MLITTTRTPLLLVSKLHYAAVLATKCAANYPAKYRWIAGVNLHTHIFKRSETVKASTEADLKIAKIIVLTNWPTPHIRPIVQINAEVRTK